MKKTIVLYLGVFLITLYAQSVSDHLYIVRSGDIIYIAKKYNQDYDIIYTFNYCMANDLYTFKTVALYSNSEDSVNENVTRPYSTLILGSTVTDNIGPVGLKVGTTGYWTGGNHLYTDSLGTQYKTALCNGYTITIEDSVYYSDFDLYTDEVIVNVSNNLFYPPELPVQNTCIEEIVEYKINSAGINVVLTHNIKRDLFISVYYGMQSANSLTQNKILMINSQYTDELDKVNEIYSGPISSYPNVYKTILSDSLKTICQEMTIDVTQGLFVNTMQYINSLSYFSRVFTSGGKTYYNQIRNKNIYSGDSYFWKGRYSWYDLNEFQIKTPLNLTIVSDGIRNVLDWEDTASAQSYYIYRSTDPYSGFNIIDISIVPNYIDTVISGSGKYFYKVTAINSVE